MILGVVLLKKGREDNQYIRDKNCCLNFSTAQHIFQVFCADSIHTWNRLIQLQRPNNPHPLTFSYCVASIS